MPSCPNHVVDASLQLVIGGVTGPVDCTAHAASNVVDGATCGRIDPNGRAIRLASNEPIPNRTSPGLNLWQVQDVMRDLYGVQSVVYVGSNALSWAAYERKRADGQPGIIQVTYAPIADSKYDAGRGFRTNHALSENHMSTFDPLADGRAFGVWRHNGVLYERSVIRRGAELLDIGNGQRAGRDKVWCLFATTDVTPDWRVVILSGTFWAYHVVAGRIEYRRQRTTGGFSATCLPPRTYPWADDLNRKSGLVRLTSGSRAGMYVGAPWARED